MVTQAPKRSNVAIAIAFALSCVGLIIFVWTQFGGTIPFAPQGYRIKAVFTETGLLVPNADVRISGVNVGKVVAVQAQGVNSLVTLDLDEQYAPIPADTRAILREKTLLGEGYIELSSGNRSGRMLPDEGTIPRTQVAQTQQLDQVLNSFTTPTQHDLQALLAGTGKALAGRGEDLNDAFGNFDPAVTELQAVVGVLNNEQGDLQSLINNSATVLTTLGDRGADLQSLVTSGDSVLSATADQNTALTNTVNDLPAFLTGLNTTLTTLNTTLQIAKPSLDALAPVAPLLTPALRGLTALSGPVVTLLRRAPTALREAIVALPAVAKFFTEFKPAVNALLPAVENIAPMINIISDYRDNLVTAMVNLATDLQAQAPANTTSDADGIPVGEAKYLRAVLSIGPDSVFGQSTRNPSVRSNAYYAPGEISNIANGGLESASCAGAGSGNTPCKVQPGFSWGHGIGTSYYPHVTKAAP